MNINSSRKNSNQLENCQKFARRLSWNACAGHELATRYLMVCQQTCNSSTKMDSRLATDDWQDWFHTFITEATTCNIVMWVARISIVDWVYSKNSDFAGDLEDSESTSEREFVNFWKPNIFPIINLDVQETNVSIPQFYRIWNHFVGCWFENSVDCLLSIFGKCYVQQTTRKDN